MDALPYNELGKLPRRVASELIVRRRQGRRSMTLYLHEVHRVAGRRPKTSSRPPTATRRVDGRFSDGADDARLL